MKRKRCITWSSCLPGALLLLVSCSPTSRIQLSPTPPAPPQEGLSSREKEAGKAGQIIFITMYMVQDSASGTTVQVAQLLRSAGTLKPGASRPLPPGPSLSCIFFAGADRLDSLQLEHPLYRQMEYVNDRHQLARRQVRTTQAEFFVRFQSGRADRVTIEERLPASKPKVLITIKL